MQMSDRVVHDAGSGSQDRVGTVLLLRIRLGDLIYMTYTFAAGSRFYFLFMVCGSHEVPESHCGVEGYELRVTGGE